MAKYSNAADREWGPHDNLAYQPELVSRLQRSWPNSQKHTLFSGDSNSDGDNMPSDYVPNSRNCKKFLIIFGLLLLVIGIAAGIVVAIYFSSQVGISERHDNTTFETIKFTSTLKLSENYQPVLGDMSSPEAQAKAKEIENKIDQIYQNSSLADAYNGTKVTRFSNGSLLVDIQMTFIVKMIRLQPDQPAVPEVNVDQYIAAGIMNSTASRSFLSIIQVSSFELVTPTTVGPSTTTAALPPQVKVLVTSLKLNDTYDIALANMSSPQAQSKAKEFQEKMDKLYKNSSLADVYNGTVVTGFSNGSVIVYFNVQFIIIVVQPEPDKPVVPEINVDLSIAVEVINTTEARSSLSIISIVSVELVTPTTVAPPTTTVEPPTTTVAPPTTTVEPPTTTVAPPTTTVEPPTKTVEPPTKTVEPPTTTVEPPTKTVEPPTKTVEPPTKTVEPPTKTVETPTKTVEPPTKTVEPPTKTVEPPTKTVEPPTKTVEPPTKTVEPPTKTVEPPTKTVEPPTKTVAPPTKTVEPPTKTVEPPTKTVEPPTKTVAPPTKTVEPPTKTAEPRTKTVATPTATVVTPPVLSTTNATIPTTTVITTAPITLQTGSEPTATLLSGAPTTKTSFNFTGTIEPGTFTTQSPSVNFTSTTSTVYRNTTQDTSYTWHPSFTSYMTSTVMTTTPSAVKCGELGLSPCSSNNQCIQENWFCDRITDCKDGSDEHQAKCGWNDTEISTGPKVPNGIELNCNFENPDQRLCKYQASKGLYTWSIQRGPTQSNFTGPNFDHSYQDETGNYVFTESSYGNFMNNASLVSDFILTDNETSSLSFYYHMYGQDMGSLSVYFDIRENGQMKREQQWTKSGDNGNYWMKACITLPASTVLRAHFVASRGRSHTSDIALDDIKYAMEPCQKLPCMFDDSMCGEVVSPSGENPALYKWRPQRSVSMWIMAEKMGLLGDHSKGSKFARYMVANSSEGSSSSKTMYKTPVLTNKNNASLNFRYFINGENVDKLTVNIRYSNSLESKTWFKNKEDSQSWHRGCLPVAGSTGTVAEFIASRGPGPDGVIAVDDIVLLKSPSCDKITECEFGKDIYCGFKVSGENYRWKMHHSIKGEFIEATGKQREGLKTMLTSEVLSPALGDSITLKYFMQGSVSLYINTMEKGENGQEVTTTLWTGNSQVTPDMLNPPPLLDLGNMQLKEVKETSNQNDQLDWMTVCVPLPSKPIAIQIVSQKRDVVKDAMALKYVGISDEKCKVGLMMTNCSFKEPNMCNYKIDCSINTQFMWHRATGSKASKVTGPQRDHTTNTTSGHFMLADSSKGRPLDKTNIVFPDIKVSDRSSFRFYYYMYGSDIYSLQVEINNQVVWEETGAKTQFWYMGCTNLPINTQFNLSLIAVRGMGPLGDIAIDDVSISNHTCPPRKIDCDFEDEMMCGYTNLPTSQTGNKALADNQWFRSNISMKDLSIFNNKFSNDFHLLTRRPSRIRSPQMQLPTKSCLQFSYFILMGKGTNITVTALYNDSAKTEEKVFGTNNFTWAEWRSGQMDLLNGNVAIEFYVQPYDRKIGDTFFAIDDVKVIPNTCQPLKCSNVNLQSCTKSGICIPKYKFCDKAKDCADGSDEKGCTSFSKDIRLVDGITTGDKGRLEMFFQGLWGSAYALQWSEVNARIACRQLGFVGFAQSVGFGKYQYGVGRLWKVKCFGNESRIQDCNLDSLENNAPHLSDVGLICYNTTCGASKTPCPQSSNSTYTYCLSKNQFCDGDLDCPDGYDEKNCSTCQNNEFYCKNKQCIPSSKYCDGLTDCKDASDEINCISKDAKGFVSVYHSGEVLPLCADPKENNNPIYSTVCMNTAQGVLDTLLTGQNVGKGVIATYNAAAKSVFGSYKLSTVSPCTQVRIECNKPECGKQSRLMSSSNTFIQYGTPALPREYPWHGLLLRNDKFVCGVTISTSKWCITAEHCVVEKGVQYEVVVGITHKKNLPKATRFKVKAIEHNPDSVIIDGIPYSDIALLLLEDEIQFNNSIQPVCLASKVYTKHDDCYLTGWGRNENLITQDHLQEAKVTVVDNEECKKFYNIDNSIICFKHDYPNMPSCYGDSGGPLVCRNSYGRFELVGVVSFGYPLCSAPNGTAAAFVNVLAMRGWIVDKTRCKIRCPNDNKCLYGPEICDGVSQCDDSRDEKAPYCISSVSCNFGSPFKCGYSNVSSNPWYWTSIFHRSPKIPSQPATGGDEKTDEFMIASLSATKDKPALMESPVFSNVPCISFLYIAHGNSSSTQTVLSVKAKLENSPAVLPIWNSNNSTIAFFQNAPPHWKLARLHLPSNTTSIIFEAYYVNPNNGSFITIDDVQVQEENCKQSCPANFYRCKNGECIKNSYTCNRITECTDGSDEMDCNQVPG